MGEFQVDSVDFVVGLVFVIASFFLLYWLFRENFKEASYAFFVRAVFTYLFCLTYIYYYKGGDTYFYWYFSEPYFNMFFYDFEKFFRVMIETPSSENWYLFNNETGYPYWHKGSPAVLLMFKYVFFFRFFGFSNYISASVLLSLVCYIVNFKLYLEIKKRYDFKYLKYTLLYMPSVLFWSAGILKDTFTYTATLSVVYCCFQMFYNNTKIKYIVLLSISIYILVFIKPYILLAILPAAFLWYYFLKLGSIRNATVRFVFMPLYLGVVIFMVYAFWAFINPYLGVYSDIESIAMKAHISYNDLKQDYYGGNSFDLGYYEPTLSGMLSKFFPALNAGLFRPYLWEVNSVTMFFSALENMVLLILTVYVILMVRFNIIKYTFSDPFLMFCFIFSIIFAFSIAISTSNFGALVRFKIPLIPFYLIYLLSLINLKKVDRHQH